jgi:hypothetical protein
VIGERDRVRVRTEWFGGLRIPRTLAAAAAITLLASGCTKRVDTPAEGGTSVTSKPQVDVAADQVAARNSWLLALAKDPQPLVALAQSSDGWRGYFAGNHQEAFEAFSKDAKKGDVAARIGLARVALELAEAHRALGQIQVASTSRWLAAMATRPNAAQTAGWRVFLSARLAARQGKPSVGAVPTTGDAALWMAGLKPDGPADLVALLKGSAAGVDASLPGGTTEAYSSRLRMPALVRAGRLKEALHLLKRLKPKAPDMQLGVGENATSLWEPGVAGAAAVVYAGVAHEAVSGLPGWPTLLAAEAEVLMGSPAAATQTLDALLGAEQPAPHLAQMVISGTLDVADLKVHAQALQIIAAHAAGDGAAAKQQYEALKPATMGQRVMRSWAGSVAGLKIAADAFPEDRGVLLKAISNEITELGPKAAGLNDVGQLMLVDRYVDQIQRRFAETLSGAGQPARAVRSWQAAEDKRAAMAPSPRNTISALAATARDQVGVGQRRVALKYLSRMAPHLPAAAAPAEMLRDLLSLQAMEQGGSATAGQ